MALTTLTGVINGLQKPQTFMKVPGTSKAASTLFSVWYAAGGQPGQGVVSSAGLAGEALTAPVTGALPYFNPPSGLAYLARFQATIANTVEIWLCDRLWQNSGISVTTTTAQTINSVAFPARDRNGTINGEDVLIGLEVAVATTNAGAVTNMGMSYTRPDGSASRTATLTSFAATAPIGYFVPFELAAGDTGVKSVQTLTLGTSLVTGTVQLIAYRVLERISLTLANADYAVDPVSGCFQQLYDGSCIWPLVWCSSPTTQIVGGSMIVAQG